MAGLICLYDTDNYLFLHCSYDEDVGKCITILKAENKKLYIFQHPVGYLKIEPNKKVFIKVEVDHDKLQFFYAIESDNDYVKIGDEFDCSFLSDEFNI